MKKIIFGTLLSFSILLGCNRDVAFVKHDVAISGDTERIAYNVYGTGETALIFVHGWSCDSRYWKNQTSVFSKDYKVIAIDLAGHGNSSTNRVDCTMLSFAKDIKAVIDREKINRAILIGHSMGGSVVAKAAQLIPQKVISIIGIDTFQNVAEQLPQHAFDEMVKPFEDNFVTAAQSFVLAMFPQETDKELVRWIKEDMSSAPKSIALSAFRNYIEQYVNSEAIQVFESITIPVVSINARLWPTNTQENKRHIKNYKLFYIEETGHFPMMEKPEEFNKLLTEALQYIRLELLQE
ncbi:MULTISPECIES: alpha/beta fold hydrolase [unclassified Saccharicrinis]|uniref:alpha/beta fold hydrolase n=1 Tax=unclassified Saccharicrinis TaxID=2646859 RepID=UPI003D3494EE